MRVTRFLSVRHIEEWEIDPKYLNGWDGTEDELTIYDWDILKHGTMLSDDIGDIDDSELQYVIESGWDDKDFADLAPWIDPDVMAS